MSAPPRLIHFRISHYNEKVRWALDHKGWPHVRESLVPGFHMPRARLLTGQTRLPVLVIDGKPIVGSGTILREIERLRPEPALFPTAPHDRARVDAIEAYFDDEVAPALRRLFWSTYLERSDDCTRMATMGAAGPTRALFRLVFPLMRPLFRRNMGVHRAELDRAHARLGEYFDRLEAEIGPSGFLVGDRFGAADLAVASVMTAIIRPPQFPYPLPEPWPPALVELRGSVTNRRGFQWVLDMYARHRPASCEVSATEPQRAHAAEITS